MDGAAAFSFKAGDACRCREVDPIKFLKAHAALISNASVVLLVLAAIYVKSTDETSAVMFRSGDAYIILGAFLALAVLRIIGKGRGKSSKGKHGGR